MTIHNLAAAYNERIRGERADNLEEAIKHYKLALEVRTPQSLPQDCRDTAYGLGRLLYDEGRFGEAREAFERAHEAVEVLRGEMVREGSRRELADENADLYARLVYSCLLPSLNPSQGEGSEFPSPDVGRGVRGEGR